MRRAYQHEALREFIETVLRVWALLWERQSGKSSTFVEMMLYEMIRYRYRTCIYGSASLLLGTEVPLKLGIRLDAVDQDIALFRKFRDDATAQVSSKGMMFQVAEQDREAVPKGLTEANFTELFKSAKLEFRVYHDRNSYSRTKVVAPNVATARGWSGTVFLDEVAFIRNLRELLTALLPIISSNKDFKLLLATTPPEFDDTHYSFELLAPPAGVEFIPNANGNWYESEAGFRVHRADAFDTHLAGKKIYDLKNGAEITPAEAFQRAPNKDGHKIAHWLWWMLGGSAACDLMRLKTAQERGLEKGCQNFLIDTDADFRAACNWLAAHLDPQAKVGLGFDVATTTKGTSNPSVVSVGEDHAPDRIVRSRFVWKTKDPDVANERLDEIIRIVSARPGGCARALAQDATNEKYFAEANRKRLRAKLPVILVVASEAVEKPGLDKPTNWKEFLGAQLVACLDDNNLTLPGDAYTRMDYRLVMRDRGRFVCEPNDQGMHGDTFDGDKLMLHALTWKTSLENTDGIFIGGSRGSRGGRR